MKTNSIYWVYSAKYCQMSEFYIAEKSVKNIAEIFADFL